MRELKKTEEILFTAKALSSSLRLKIIGILNERKEMNLNDLSDALGVTNGALTAHIRLMQKAGIIGIQSSAGKRGSQKICFLQENKYLFDTTPTAFKLNAYESELPVGSFSNYSVFPTCGIATKEKIIGEVDDPRYFDDPLRTSASIVWLTKGYFEYRIPNYLQIDQKPVEIQISLELSSEAPGFCDEWPSDIHFFINGRKLGFWTSPGDFGSVRGLYTPDWWPSTWNQYGLLKLLSVNREGSFVDGVRISDTAIGDVGVAYKSDILFRLAVLEESQHIGGLTIYGNSFGNYHQDIRVRILYEHIRKEATEPPSL